MLKFIKEYWQYLKTEGKIALNELKSIKTAYKQIPNLLTISRLLATIPINILFFTGNIMASLITCGVAAFTDFLDGPIARKCHSDSQFGADLDAICDKLFIGLMALPIVIQNPFMLANIGLEAAITYTNVQAKKEGKEVKSAFIGKAKTWALSLTVLAGYLLPLLQINPSLLASFLMTVPAAIFQTATLAKYLEINHKDGCQSITISYDPDDEEEIEIIPVKQAEEKKLQKEFIKPATVEELKKEREKLLQNVEEKGHQKVKTDLK